MRAEKITIVVGAALCLNVVAGALIPARAQELTLRVEQGLVTMSARNVAVREILERWAQVTGAVVVNGDRAAGRVTLEFVNEPEGSALASILRGVSGYVLAFRASGAVPVGATIDRILIAPASTALPRIPTQALTARAVRPARQEDGINRLNAAGPEQMDAGDGAGEFQPSTTGGETRLPVSNPADWVLAPSIPPVAGQDASLPAPAPLYIGPNGERSLRQPTQEPGADTAPPAAPTQPSVPPNPFGIRTGADRPGPSLTVPSTKAEQVP